MLLTVHLHFTQFNPVVFSIPFRIRRMGSVVVVYDISPVVRTCNVDRIRYRGSGVVGVSKTQHSVLFFCWVGNVERESKEELCGSIVLIYWTKNKSIFWKTILIQQTEQPAFMQLTNPPPHHTHTHKPPSKIEITGPILFVNKCAA